MHTIQTHKQPYVKPVLLQQAEILLEKNLLGSVVDNVQPVETAGHEVAGEYNYSDYSSSNAIDHEWGDVIN